MDKYVLLIETATDSCSVALSRNSEIISEKFINEPKAHASVIGGYVTDILAENSISMADCSAVAVSKGPGSYTGLRVGVSTAKGLCFGSGKPLLAVGTLDTLVAQANSVISSEVEKSKPGIFDGFKTVFTTPTALALTIGFSGFIFVITGYMTWVPAFLQEEFGQTQAAAGFNSMFWTYLAAFAGVLLAGTLSDKIAIRDRKVRMVIQGIGLILGAAFLFFVGADMALWGIYLCFAGWGFFRAFFDANIYTVLYDVTPSRLHASCSSALITTGFAVGALAPVILGAMKDSMGSLSATFPVLGAVWIVCGVLMLIISRTHYQKDYDKINKTL